MPSASLTPCQRCAEAVNHDEPGEVCFPAAKKQFDSLVWPGFGLAQRRGGITRTDKLSATALTTAPSGVQSRVREPAVPGGTAKWQIPNDERGGVKVPSHDPARNARLIALYRRQHFKTWKYNEVQMEWNV
jgi:hypothetical protein